MSFKEDYMKSCIKFASKFDKMCEIGRPVLGNITQCGITEYDNTGHISIAANRPDFAEFYVENDLYKITPHWVYHPNKKEEFSPSCSDDFMRFMWSKQGILYGSGFDNNHSFFYRERINNGEAYRHYFFCSDEPKIYKELVNNIMTVKKFINFYQQESQEILDFFKDNKLNLASERDDYFENSIKDNIIEPEPTEKIKTMELLKKINILDNNTEITDREWECLKWYSHGKSAKTIGEILNVSNRTVETHLTNVKKKLSCSTRSELSEKLFT